MRFQDTIYGRELAAQGRGRRIAQGRQNYEALKALYVDMHDVRLLAYAEEAGLLTKAEVSDVWEYLISKEGR